uniref:NADH-ubiquinone oxidoreductase chain 6 n=1 Tax=Gastrallus laevigatus TaxID=1586484 RepID=A0A343C2Z4_9COLE|nr:NADH dehydrogenase subunit 6 [Gastrallus laevigatus]
MLVIMLSIMFITQTHPLMAVILLIITTTCTAMMTGNMLSTFWFSYMIFLIMVGGMLVVFIYMTSIASNELLKMNLKTITMLIPITMTLMILEETLSMDFNIKESNYETMMIKFINYPFIWITITMVLYLLITLIATVKITNMKMGPLRQKY